MFVDDEAAQDMTVKLANETPRFSGSVHLDVKWRNARCRIVSDSLQARIGGVGPAAGSFSRRRDEPIRWNLVTAEADGSRRQPRLLAACAICRQAPDLQDRISARRLTAAQQAAMGLAAGGEVWELTFRQPGNKPMEIQAVRSSTLTADTPLSFAELVKASEQQGSVAIWAPAGECRKSIIGV